MTRTLICALGLTAALVLPGCSSGAGEAAPTGTPTASVSSSPPTTTVPPPPTVDPTPTAPVFDYSKSKKTKAGAEEFGRHVIAAMDFLVHVGDSEPFKNASLAVCPECNTMIKQTAKDLADSVVITGGPFVVRAIESTVFRGDSGDTQARVLIKVKMPPQTVSEPGKGDIHRAAETRNIGLHLFWTPAGWRIGGMGE